jgi:hypothetical protein
LKRIATGVAGGLAALILSATASTGIRITTIFFDSPGSDTGSDARRPGSPSATRSTARTGERRPAHVVAALQ